MHFFIKLFAVSVLAAAVIFLLQTGTNLLADFVLFSWYSLFFLMAITLISFYLLQIGLKLKGHTQFMQYFGAMFGFKVFSSLLFVCYFIYVEPVANKKFVLVFFILYAMFTALLVSEAWKILKRKS